MDDFKITNFERENPNKKFPGVISLKEKETKKIFDIFKQRMDSKFIDGLELVRKLDMVENTVLDINAKSENFYLTEVFAKLDIFPKDNVYINWYRYDKIDQMQFNDLAQYFNYIWYPDSDDIDLFDDSFSWIVSINHEGIIKSICF